MWKSGNSKSFLNVQQPKFHSKIKCVVNPGCSWQYSSTLYNTTVALVMNTYLALWVPSHHAEPMKATPRLMWLISEVVLWFAVLSRFIQKSLNTDFHEIRASFGFRINLQEMRALVFSSLRWNTRGNNLKEGKVSPGARSQRSQTKVSHLGYYSYGSM